MVRTISSSLLVGRVVAALAALSSSFVAAGCDSTSTPRTNVTVPATGLAVLNSDYMTTSVSLIDALTRTLSHDACVDSHTVAPQPSLALSGDVMLPSRPQVGGDVVLIDDFNKALTWVDPQACAIRFQVSVSDFKSYPHDIISISATKSYVTRYGANPNPTDDPMSRGDDLLILNPRADGGPAILGRIDLAPFAATSVSGAAIRARPDKGLLVGDKAYVSLGSQSDDFSATGEGRIVIVDTNTDTVSGMIALPGLAGCARLNYLNADHTLYAACGGDSSALDQARTAGVAMIDLAVDPPVVSKVVPASALGGHPVNFSWVAPFSGDLFFAGTFGVIDFASGTQLAPDATAAVVPSSGQVTALTSGGAYELGRAAMVFPSTLYLPDADPANPLVHLYDVSVTGASPAGDLDANPSVHLPPREVAFY
jgi:hypothetical protein